MSHQPEVSGPPTTSRLRPGSLASVLERNIRALGARKRQQDKRASLKAKLAETIARLAGSMGFVALHVVGLSAWIALNQGLFAATKGFDPSYAVLNAVTSVEALFLSTFILISQNRAAVVADRRAELDVQVNLLSEHEITRLLQLTVAIAEKLKVEAASDPSLVELEEHIAPEKVLDRIEQDEGPVGI